MDAHTLGLLQFDKVRELLAGYAASSLGRELARGLSPSTDATWIRGELALVTEMVTALGSGPPPPFGGLHDVRMSVRRAAIGTMLTAEQLLQVSETLACIGGIYRYRMRLDQSLTGLADLLAGVEDLGVMAKTIGGMIDGRGHVLDMASRELAAVRQRLFELDERVKSEIKRLLRDPELRKALSYPNATVNGDHYVLPVAVNHRHKVPGVVHRVSNTGETVFVEPASIANLSAERVTIKAEEEREVRRILRKLSAEVGRIAKPTAYALDVAARLDLLTAKASYSRDYGMFAPDLTGDGRLWLRGGRHPLLAHLFRTANDGRQVVPIDVRLGVGFNLLVVTGPNTGGKTVTLKTVGLICVMAQCGLHIPAGEGSLVPVFKHVLADIGDEQSLEQSLSTFSSHITRIKSIFEVADANSLVLLDELGAGTDPLDGAALGRAILDTLDEVGCRGVVTTHLGDLKTYAFNNPRAENGAVEFDIETLRPTYRLLIGQFGQSNGLRIAKRLKLPKELVAKAHKYLRKKKGRGGELARLQELREEAEKAKQTAHEAEQAATKQRAEFEKMTATIEREAKEQADLHAWRLGLQVGDAARVKRFDGLGKVVRVNLVKQTVTVSVGLGQWETPFPEVFPA